MGDTGMSDYSEGNLHKKPWLPDDSYLFGIEGENQPEYVPKSDYDMFEAKLESLKTHLRDCHNEPSDARVIRLQQEIDAHKGMIDCLGAKCGELQQMVDERQKANEGMSAACAASDEHIDKLEQRISELERGEYICRKCGLRKDGESGGEF